MSEVISCGKCDRKFAWKPELAGKRVRCKCGEPIAVRAAAAVASHKAVASPPKKPVPLKPADGADLDDLIAFAEDADRAAAALPVEVVDFVPPPVPVVPVKKVGRSLGAGVAGVPLGYQSGPSARERKNAADAAAALVDPIRDLYVPLALLAAGFVIYIAYFGVRFHLGANGLAAVGIGVILLTVIKTTLLVGFALFVSGPLGVGFGNVGPAILKLAAIAVFVDAVCSWVDMGIGRMSGGTGGGTGFGFGVIGWPIAIGMYWALLIYLFSMDPGDSWLVVVVLSIFDRLVRTVLFMVLLQVILSWSGVAIPASMGKGIAGNASSIHASALATHVDDLKEADALVEAKKYISQGHQAVAFKSVDAWYNTGCPNVWYEMSRRDINGKRNAEALIVELPDDKAKRAKCYDILKGYFKDESMYSDPSDFIDTGEQYLEVGMR
jgi:hypothetical protein